MVYIKNHGEYKSLCYRPLKGKSVVIFSDKKLLLKDYNLMKENQFFLSKIVIDDPQKHFDIINVFTKVNKPKGDNLTLMNIQHILVKICDFENWDDFLHSSKAKQEIGALKLNYYKIGMDPNAIDAAEMMVEHELFAEFVDDDGDVNYTDDDELELWIFVLERVQLIKATKSSCFYFPVKDSCFFM